MKQVTYGRTELSEARRRLAQAETWYERLYTKNREAEAKYREKISFLEDRLNELTKKEAAK